MKILPVILLAFASLPLWTQISVAQTDYRMCILCEEPDTVYQCVVNGPGNLKKNAVSVMCLVKLAKKHGHAKCRKLNKAQNIKCEGKLVSLEFDGPVISGVTVDRGSSEQKRRGSGVSLPRVDKDVPGNLKDFTKHSMQKTKDNVQNLGQKTGELISGTGKIIANTGNAVGTGVKKTGQFFANSTKCLFSLFQNCNSSSNWDTTTSTENVPDTASRDRVKPAAPAPELEPLQKN